MAICFLLFGQQEKMSLTLYLFPKTLFTVSDLSRWYYFWWIQSPLISHWVLTLIAITTTGFAHTGHSLKFCVLPLIQGNIFNISKRHHLQTDHWPGYLSQVHAAANETQLICNTSDFLSVRWLVGIDTGTSRLSNLTQSQWKQNPQSEQRLRSWAGGGNLYPSVIFSTYYKYLILRLLRAESTWFCWR